MIERMARAKQGGLAFASLMICLSLVYLVNECLTSPRSQRKSQLAGRRSLELRFTPDLSSTGRQRK